jgi:hypothetical protein
MLVDLARGSSCPSALSSSPELRRRGCSPRAVVLRCRRPGGSPEGSPSARRRPGANPASIGAPQRLFRRSAAARRRVAAASRAAAGHEPLPPLLFVQGRRILNQRLRLDWTPGQNSPLPINPALRSPPSDLDPMDQIQPLSLSHVLLLKRP